MCAQSPCGLLVSPLGSPHGNRHTSGCCSLSCPSVPAVPAPRTAVLSFTKGTPVSLCGLPAVSRALCHSRMCDSIPDNRHSALQVCTLSGPGTREALLSGVLLTGSPFPRRSRIQWLGGQGEAGSADMFLLPAGARGERTSSDFTLRRQRLDCFFWENQQLAFR